MAYSRWASKDETKNIKELDSNTMIIESTGNCKLEGVIIPKLKEFIKEGESFLISDDDNTCYKELIEELNNKNYNVVLINLKNIKESNGFNPLTIPYNFYKEGNKDTAVELLDRIGHYLFCPEEVSSNVDPFWTNSAASLFVGLALYLFEKEDKDITLGNIFKLSTDLDALTKEIEKMDKISPIYVNLSNILFAPKETKGSIASVFMQNLKLFIMKESLLKVLSENTFNTSIDKTAVFIVSDNTLTSRRLVPIIMEEYYSLVGLNNNKGFNIVLDDFGDIMPIKDFVRSLRNGNNIKFTICIKSLLDLKNLYGKESSEIIKMMFPTVIYLMASDIETLEEISKLCGNTKNDNVVEPLITPEELKLLDKYEAIILIPRIYPIRMNLL